MKTQAQWPVLTRLLVTIRSREFVAAVGVMIVALAVTVRPDWVQYENILIVPAVALGVALIVGGSLKDGLAAIGSGKPLDQAVAAVATNLEQAIIPGLPAITPQMIDAIAAAITKQQQPIIDAMLKTVDSHMALATQVIQANTSATPNVSIGTIAATPPALPNILAAPPSVHAAHAPQGEQAPSFLQQTGVASGAPTNVIFPNAVG